MARPTKEKQYLFDKRRELIWALSHQDYSNADIGIIFNRDASVITRIVNQMPKDWEPKWTKVL